MRGLQSVTLSLSLAVLLAGCGGGGSSGAPVPTPTPAPAPAPTPSPTPSPTPTAASAPHGEQLAGIGIPGQLGAEVICSTSPVTVAEGHVTGIASAAALNRSTMTIDVGADFSYEMDINGFGGSRLSQGDYIAGPIGGQAFAVYLGQTPGYTGADELQIARKLTLLDYSTYGVLGNGGLCFYAAAQKLTPPSSPYTGYHGYADGLSQIDGDADRLYGSTFVATYNASAKNYQVEIDLKSVESAFEEPAGQAPQSLGKATAAITFVNGFASSTVLAGPAGYSGTIAGSMQGAQGTAMLLTFEMSDAHGNRIWGVVAADANGM